MCHQQLVGTGFLLFFIFIVLLFGTRTVRQKKLPVVFISYPSKWPSGFAKLL